MRVARLLLAVTIVAPSALAVAATPKPVVIAMLDSGIRPTHQEFANNQVVAWWDFTADKKPAHLPAAGQTWDAVVSTPYDDVGHGTSTAAMAAGLNVAGSGKDPSYAPGTKLAIAKVLDSTGSDTGRIAAALDWAVDTVHADVINVSIGSSVPLPALLTRAELTSLRHARSSGVLVTVSNGNGYANYGIPGDEGWMSAFAESTDVLAVGASGVDAVEFSLDPEVVAKAVNVKVATNTGDAAYAVESGTSFAAPAVAGMAAAALAGARANGHAVSADYLEKLLKYSAQDTALPPNLEGYGVLDAASFPGLISFAVNAGLPGRPAPDANALYVDCAQQGLRDAWANQLRLDTHATLPGGCA